MDPNWSRSIRKRGAGYVRRLLIIRPCKPEELPSAHARTTKVRRAKANRGERREREKKGEKVENVERNLSKDGSAGRIKIKTKGNEGGRSKLTE